MGCDDRRSTPVSFFEDFEEIVAGAGVERLEAEVVEDQEIGAAEGFDETRVAPVAARERKVFAELRPAMIDDGTIVAAGLLADGASEPTFADARWADESQIVVGVDPLAFGEFLEQGAVEPARGAVVDVFDAGLLAEFCGAQPAPSAACRVEETLPDQAAERASRCGRSLSPHLSLRVRRRPWPFRKGRGRGAGRGWDV